MTDIASLRYLLQSQISDGPHETPEFVETGIPFLSVDNILNGQISFDNCRFISESDHRRFSLKARPVLGDVLITKAASVGRVALVETTREFNVWSPIAIIRPQKELLDARFLYYVLQGANIQDQIVRSSTSNTQQNIAMAALGALKIPLLGRNIQVVIADYLDRETARIDALIEKKKRLTELASELVGSKIESVLDKFASNCPRPSLAYVLAAPITDGPHETPEFTESGVPFLSVDNIQESQINFSDTRFISNEENVRFSRKSKPRPGDVLLTKAASVGKVALVATDLEFNIWSPIAILRPNHEILSSEYLWWLFRSPRVQMQLQLYATSNTQQNISMRDLSSIRLDVPSLDAQVKCVNQLNKVDVWSRSLMTKISKDTDLLKERRQALITAAVTGELEISEEAA